MGADVGDGSPLPGVPGPSVATTAGGNVGVNSESLPTPSRLRASRARLAYTFERYVSGAEIESVDAAAIRVGTTRETLALLVARGRLAVVEPLKSGSDGPGLRYLLSAEVDLLARR